MKTIRRLSFWLKAGQAVALAIAVCFTIGAADPVSRTNKLSHRVMCTCSCAQMLGECDHVGCPNRDEELALLRTGVDSNSPDQQIMDAFVEKYGATVLAAPTTRGFDLVAWIAPFAVLAAALLGTILLIRHWVATSPKLDTAPASPEMDALRERIRRETGADGGFSV